MAAAAAAAGAGLFGKMSAGAGPVLGAGVSAAGNLVNSGISYRKQKKLLKRQQNFAHQERLEAEEYQRRMWHETFNAQNAYNDPSAVMARLKSAGLNPDLYYGGNAQFASQGGATLSSNAGQAMPVTPAGEASAMAGFDNIGTLAREISTINLQDSQSELNRKKADTEDTIQLLNGAKVALTDEQTKWTKGQQRHIETEITLMQKQGEKIDALIRNIDMNTDLTEQQLKELKDSYNDRMKQYYLANEKLYREIGLADATIRNYDDYMEAFIDNLDSQTNINVENRKIVAKEAFYANEELTALKARLRGDIKSKEQQNLFDAMVSCFEATFTGNEAMLQKQLELLQTYGDAEAILGIVGNSLSAIFQGVMTYFFAKSSINQMKPPARVKGFAG